MNTKALDRLLALGPPLSYFWVAEYYDGTTVSQFDLHSGAEIKWADVAKKNKRITSMLWVPFSPVLAKKILSKSNILCHCLPQDRIMRAFIPDGAEIILKRKGFMPLSGGNKKRAYILGFKYNGETAVIARDTFGVNIDPKMVAGWVRDTSATNDKGRLIEHG